MPRNRLVLIAAAAAVLLVGIWWYVRSGRENVAVDLIQQLPSAKLQPSADPIAAAESTINGVAKRAITIQNITGTRITWKVTVPDNATLLAGLGILEQGWTMPGDGVVFAIGVSDGKNYDELMSLMVNPFANASDRKWNDISIDLAQYAGETVDVIFNTRSGTKDDRNGDFAVWGEPRIVVK
jgi:hypothetical protein